MTNRRCECVEGAVHFDCNESRTDIGNHVRRRYTLFVALVAMTFVASACADDNDSNSTGEKCGDKICANDETCINDVCTPKVGTCTSDMDCPNGQTCKNGSCNNSYECNSATHINTCANNILTKCENNTYAIEFCQNGCAADGKSCVSGGVPTQCDSATYVNKCTDNILLKCENNAYTAEFCKNGCAADGKSCASDVAQCNSATYINTCTNNILTKCENDAYVTETCPNGCAEDGKSCAGGVIPPQCNSATYINTCANNILTKCENDTFVIETCPNGCADDGKSCDGGAIVSQCDSATYINTCTNNILTKCVNNAYVTETCPNGCATDGKSCDGGAIVSQCDSATYIDKCTNNILTKCENDTFVFETCPNGCADDGKSCATELTCQMGPGTMAAGTTYNQFTYTGCACDANYVKSCGVVDGKEVAFTCYFNKKDNSYNEEYIACENCRIENGRYECGSTPQCDSATYVNTCANNILTKCVNNAYVTETCSNGCATDGKSCASGSEFTCAMGPGTMEAGATYNQYTYTGCACDANYVKSCGVVDGKEVAFTCYYNKKDNSYNEEYLACENCRIENGRYECGATPQCNSSTYVNTCTNNILTKCVNGAVVTETCSNGCADDGKSCAGGGGNEFVCELGPGTMAAGTTSNQYTYTGCKCDGTFVKRCGVVDGKEVAFTCYKENEEYLACEKCRIEGDRYECGGGGGSTIPGEGEVNIVDPKYPQLNIVENSTATSSLEQHGTEQNSGPRDPAVETCGTLTISGSNTCSKTGSSKTKYVIQGDILTKDKTYLGGSVVIENGKITSVGCTADTSNATVITCPDAVVSAGLINAHDHITYSNAAPASWGAERFDHRHDWRKGKEGHTKVPGPQTDNNEVPELRQIMGGTTSIFGSGKVQGLARNIDKENQVTGSSSYPTYDTFPLGDSGGTLASSGCSKYKLSGKYNTKYFYAPHIGEGINDASLNEFVCLSDESKLANEFSSKLAVIHGVSATPKYIKLFADTGAKLIWSPRTNVSLYGDTARVTVYDNMGVTIALGSDWIYSGSANMLREFQCVDFLNTYYYNKHFSDYDVWRMATYNGAHALGLENYIGDLKAGLLADISVFKKGTGNRIMHRAVLEATNKDVTLVMIDGKMVYGDANLMDAGDTVDVCGSSKKVDTKGAGGSSKSYSQIDNAKAYRLFFCDKPENEPTCVPIRTRPADTTSQGTTMYDGEYSDPNDIDGDGIPNDVDNCPNVFNPVRPEDKNAASKLGQGDWDGDGFGDVCDKFPIDKSQH